jgi:hypothetical protein
MSHALEPSLAGPPNPDLGSYYLVIRDLQINAQPGVIYTIYLNTSESASDKDLQAHKVGYLNFFHVMPGMEMNEPARFVSYDISELVKALDIFASSAGVFLTIIPSGEPAAGSEPVIGSVAIQKVQEILYDQLGKLQPRDITVTTHPRRIATLADIGPI